MLPHSHPPDIFITTLQGEQGRSTMRLESTINKEKRKKKGITQEEKKKFSCFSCCFVALVLQILFTRERKREGWLQTIGGFFFYSS